MSIRTGFKNRVLTILPPRKLNFQTDLMPALVVLISEAITIVVWARKFVALANNRGYCAPPSAPTTEQLAQLLSDVRAPSRRAASVGGQCELKYRAARHVRACPQSSIMRLDYRATDREP